MTTIRIAEPGEADAIYRVYRASILAYGPEVYDRAQVAAWAGNPADVPDYPIQESGHRFVVAEREGVLIGFGHLVFDDAEITAVYVHPEHTRRGVGTAILADLEAAARERGIQTLGLMASRNAVPFYEQAGYEPIEERVHEIEGEELLFTRMEKDLG